MNPLRVSALRETEGKIMRGMRIRRKTAVVFAALIAALTPGHAQASEREPEATIQLQFEYEAWPAGGRTYRECSVTVLSETDGVAILEAARAAGCILSYEALGRSGGPAPSPPPGECIELFYPCYWSWGWIRCIDYMCNFGIQVPCFYLNGTWFSRMNHSPYVGQRVHVQDGDIFGFMFYVRPLC